MSAARNTEANADASLMDTGSSVLFEFRSEGKSTTIFLKPRKTYATLMKKPNTSPEKAVTRYEAGRKKVE